MNPAWIRATNLSRHYGQEPNLVRALEGVDLALARGELLAVIGSSGSGKSTLLNLLAGLDTPTTGRIEFDGTVLGELSPRALAAHRARRVGMIFQSFNLLPQYSALRNVELALCFNDTPHAARRARSAAMLERLGLGQRLQHRPADLSGGEQQRVAIARALVKQPDLILADEPTGNLDQENARQIADLLGELHRQGLTIIVATHDLELAERLAQRSIQLRYGRLVAPAGGGGEVPS